MASTSTNERFVVVGLDLTNQPDSYQLLFCVGGTFTFYLLNGYLQEAIFRYDGFEFGWFLTFFVCLTNATLSFLQRNLAEKPMLQPNLGDDVEPLSDASSDQLVLPAPSRRKKGKAPMAAYSLISLFLVASVGLANVASEYVSYPTVVLFKSSKLIPVMIGGRLLLGRRYQFLEYISALLLTIGLIVMTLSDWSQVGFDRTGTILLCMALCADAFIGNYQERTMKRYECSDIDLVYYGNLIGALYIFIIIMLSGELFEAVAFASENPDILLYMLMFGCSAFFGVLFVLPMIRRFGAFIAMTATSCRKAVSLSLSYLLFPNEFTTRTAIAVILVFSGLGVHIFEKNRNAILKAWESAKDKRVRQLQKERIARMQMQSRLRTV